jgi:LPXTG-motif cell wall-anchored protein
MSVKKSVLIVMAAVFVLGAGFAVAQTTTYEIKQGTVLNHHGNHLIVKMADGEVRDVEVPEGFMFNIDGQDVPLSALKPGTKLTSTVKTTTTPKPVQVTEVRNVEVVRRNGQTIIIRNQEGKLVQYNRVPDNIKLMADGKEILYNQVYAGMKLNAYIVHTGMTEVTEQDVAVSGSAPVAKAAPAQAPAPVAAPAMLPKTGSSLPLVGLGGIALLIFAIGIAVIRRF